MAVKRTSRLKRAQLSPQTPVEPETPAGRMTVVTEVVEVEGEGSPQMDEETLSGSQGSAEPESFPEKPETANEPPFEPPREEPEKRKEVVEELFKPGDTPPIA